MKKWKRLLMLKIARRLSKNDNSIPVPTIIGSNATIKGDIISDGILQIDGQVEGDVECSELVIGLKGSVSGCVKTQNMQLYGVLKGKAFVDDLFVSKTAKLIGDATHNSIAIEPGAYIDGHCMRADNKVNSSEKKKADLTVIENTKVKSKAKAG